MGIFLRQGYKIPPTRWGSSADVQYAIKVNSEKIYGFDSDNQRLVFPFFWGSLSDFSMHSNIVKNHGTTFSNGSLYLNGAGQHVEVLDSPSLQFSGGHFSVRCWIRPDVVSPHFVILYKGPVGDRSIMFWITPTSIKGAFEKEGGSKIDVLAASSFVINRWYFCAFTFGYDGLKVYVNGIEKGNRITPSVPAINMKSIVIGRSATNENLYATGRFSDVCLVKGAHTSDQISLFYDLPYGLYQKVSRPIYLFPGDLTTPPPTTIGPTTLAPTSLAPTTLAPTTLGFTTSIPTTSYSTTPVPTTWAPTSGPATTPLPTTIGPTTLIPTTLTPTSLTPTTLAPTTVAPTTLYQSTLAPTTLTPSTKLTTTPEPTTIVPTTDAPTSLTPTTLAPTTLTPTTLASTTLVPTTIMLTTILFTTLVPTTNIPELICIKYLKSTITKEFKIDGNLC